MGIVDIDRIAGQRGAIYDDVSVSIRTSNLSQCSGVFIAGFECTVGSTVVSTNSKLLGINRFGADFVFRSVAAFFAFSLALQNTTASLFEVWQS